jgi:gluconolactonase
MAQKAKIPPHDVSKDLRVELDMLAPGAERITGEKISLELIAKDIVFGEGPVWDRRKKQFFFTDIVGDTIWKWAPGDRLEVLLRPTVHANGMTIDLEGRLLVAGWGGRTVFRIEEDGSRSTLASHYDGKQLNSPNDIVVKSDGAIYFTDPPGGMLNVGHTGYDLQRYLDYSGVFRISPDGKKMQLVNSEFVYPNGLCFSPDEKLLYVNCSRERLIRVYDVHPDGGLANGQLFYRYSGPERGNPDGMKCDVEGNVYCTGPGGIWIHSPYGGVLGRLKMAGHPTNFAFGDDDWKTLYIAMMGSVVRTRWNIPGVALW